MIRDLFWVILGVSFASDSPQNAADSLDVVFDVVQSPLDFRLASRHLPQSWRPDPDRSHVSEHRVVLLAGPFQTAEILLDPAHWLEKPTVTVAAEQPRRHLSQDAHLVTGRSKEGVKARTQGQAVVAVVQAEQRGGLAHVLGRVRSDLPGPLAVQLREAPLGYVPPLLQLGVLVLCADHRGGGGAAREAGRVGELWQDGDASANPAVFLAERNVRGLELRLCRGWRIDGVGGVSRRRRWRPRSLQLS